MKTLMANESTVKREWFIVDAAGLELGRLASQVASILRGKNKPTFTPNVDCGDHVIVINTDKMVLTGNKLDQKLHRYHTQHMGGLKEIKYRKFMNEKSDEVLMVAVKGMLPKNSLGRKMAKKLRVYKADKHEHHAQKPQTLELIRRQA